MLESAVMVSSVSESGMLESAVMVSSVSESGMLESACRCVSCMYACVVHAFDTFKFI
jgi:hypothetical protein